jgi:23S rRNA U2552 (ribose-2'-O)-methylase RlmE/FtsJ
LNPNLRYKIIAVSQPAAAKNALEEIIRADAAARLVKYMSPGEQLIEISVPLSELESAVKNKSIFLRDIMPVNADGTYTKPPAPYYGVSLISRAGYKLLEAIDRFGLTLPKNGRALDLGASPGGFCEVLLNAGLFVTAVDPAEMDSRISSRGNFTHFKGLAQDFPPEGTFDVITNDMRLDIAESTRIMNSMPQHMASGGFGVIILKLSDGRWMKKTDKALDKLSEFYSIIRAKQLFHNRSEVTVLVRKE